jgi:hypothetical protein
MSPADQMTAGATSVSTPTIPAMSRLITSRIVVLRIGAVSGVVGAILASVANLLHPHPTDYQLETKLAQMARSSTWGAVHLILIVALMFVFVALVALTLSLEREPGVTLSRMACVTALLGGTLILVSTALDGFAMSRLADEWVKAPAAEKADALRAASALEEAQYAVYSMSIVLFLGLGIVLYGIALVLDGEYPAWLGWLAILGGGGEVVVGIVQVLSGPTYRGTELPDAAFSVMITLWVLIVGIHMWRQSRTQHTRHDQIESAPAIA